jgi:hypothetical protein
VGLDTLYSGVRAGGRVFRGWGSAIRPTRRHWYSQGGAYIWWGSALDSVAYELPRIDSLLALAMARAR